MKIHGATLDFQSKLEFHQGQVKNHILKTHLRNFGPDITTPKQRNIYVNKKYQVIITLK